MTEQQLREIEERARKAGVVMAGTRVTENGIDIEARFVGGQKFAVASLDEDLVAVATLYAHAHKDIPALVAEVRELRRVVVECSIPLWVLSRRVHAGGVHISPKTVENINAALDTARKALGE